MRKGLKGLFIILALLLGSLLILVLFRYISSPGDAVSTPPYEEIYSISSDLDHEIKKIDTLLFEALYHYKIPEEDIFFAEVEYWRNRIKGPTASNVPGDCAAII